MSLPKHIPIYTGKLGVGTKLPDMERRGYNSWRAQCERCNNPSSKYYRWYGAKGVTVNYSSREFMSWWVYEYSRNLWVYPTTSRVDHNGNYDFDNIKMEEMYENNQEPNIKRFIHYSSIKLSVDGEYEKTFKSIKEASEELSLPKTTILKLLQKKKTKPVYIYGSVTFSYTENGCANDRKGKKSGRKTRNSI